MTIERTVPNLTPEVKEWDVFRVSLNPVEEADLEYIRDLRNRHKQFFFYQREITPEQQQIWWKKYLARPREEYTFYVIKLRRTGENIGTTSLTKIKDGVYEFGNNVIDDQYQGKGYFREVYQQALAILGNNTLVAQVLPENKHMQDIYRKFRLNQTEENGAVIFSNGPR